jgi:hypothetical protein
LLVLDYDTSRVANVGAEELLSECEHRDTSGATESYIHYAGEQLVIAIQESVVEGNADLVSVESLVLLILLQLLGVLFEHEAKLSVEVLRQLLLEELTYLLSVLAVTISNGKEVTVFETAEVRNCDPHILIHLVGIARR